MTLTPTDVEAAVDARYGAGAQAAQPELCCPVDYDASLLEVIPAEVLGATTAAATRPGTSARARPSWTWARAGARSPSSPPRWWVPRGG